MASRTAKTAQIESVTIHRTDNSRREPSSGRAHGADRLRIGLAARNTVWNLIGLGGPLAVALFAIPVLIQSLGTERFGVLSLVWAVIGYFGVFDLGLGRALTKTIAERLQGNKGGDCGTIAWTTILLMAGLGVAAGCLLAVLSGWLVHEILKVPAGLRDETVAAFLLVAFSMPAVIVTIGLRGLLEAHQEFRAVNLVRIATGIYTFLSPLFVLACTRSLTAVVAVLAAGRIVVCVVHWMLCSRLTTDLQVPVRLSASAMRPLCRFGSWMTVSNVVGPVMSTADRFLIGGTISVSAVAHYNTPNEVTSRIGIIPTAVGVSLFPAFAGLCGSDPREVGRLLLQGLRWVLLSISPICLLAILFAPEALGLWLGPEFAAHASSAARWLVGVHFINSVVQLPATLMQAVGRPEVLAKLQLLELPLYLLALVWVLPAHGIVGAAAVTLARASLDLVVLCWAARTEIGDSKPALTKVLLAVGATAASFALATLPSTPAVKCVFFLATGIAGLIGTHLLLPRAPATLPSPATGPLSTAANA